MHGYESELPVECRVVLLRDAHDARAVRVQAVHERHLQPPGNVQPGDGRHGPARGDQHSHGDAHTHTNAN